MIGEYDSWQVSNFAKSVKWSALAEVCSRAATPLLLVALARLLVPEDFGVVAVATLATSFAQVLWEGGLGRALVQTQTNQQAAANVVFWTNIALGLLAFVSLQLFAEPLVSALGAPHATPVLRVLAFQTIIGSLGSVQQALCVREMEFQKLFWVRLLAGSAPGLFSIPLALSGHGVWALVGGSLIGQMLSVALLWRLSAWRPVWSYNWSLARQLLGFGLWVVLESLGGWLIMSGDNLFVGRYLGSHELGLYRTGSALVLAIFSATLGPFTAVSYPLISRIQGDREQLRRVFLQITKLIICVSIALGAGIGLVGPKIADVLFGQTWIGVGYVISLIGLTQGIAWLVGLNPEVFRAIGRPDVNTKLMYTQIIVYTVVYWITARYSTEIFCLGRLMLAVLWVPAHLWLAHVLLGVPGAYIWKAGRHALLAAIVMALAIVCLRQAGLPATGLAALGAEVAVGVGVFLGVLWYCDRDFFSDFRSITSDRLHSC